MFYIKKVSTLIIIVLLSVLFTACSSSTPNIQSDTAVSQQIESLQSDKQSETEKQEVSVLQVEELSQEQTNPVQSKNISKSVDIHFIDTGNSDSILISDNGKYMIIDGADNNDEQMLVDYLSKLNITKIDYVVLTHPDADHCGGLDTIIKNFGIGEVFVGNGDADTKTYKDFVQSAIDKNLTPSVPLPDKTFTLGSGTFTFYNQKSKRNNANDNSLVALYTIGSNNFLFMGDSGKEVEASLPLDQIGKIDVLKVGHHGSKTSSSDSFISSILPRYSVICCGKDNQYGHPHQEPLDTLNLYKSKIYRTDINGTIVFTSDGKSLSVECTKIPEKAIISSQEVVGNPNSNVVNSVDDTVPLAEVESISTNEDKSVIVYLTKTGSKYHRAGCRHLNKSKIPCTLEEAKLGYEPCSVCKP